MRIAYLTSEYPAVSHTFIMREVLELRRRGVDIQTFSVREPRADSLLTDIDRAEHASTWYIQPIAPLKLLGSQLWAIFRHPVRYVSTFFKMLRLRTPGLRGLIKWLAYFAQGVHLGRELERRGVDHLHNHIANASSNVAMLAALFLGIPWSFVLHNIMDLEWEGVGDIRDKVALAKYTVGICDFNRSQAMRRSNFEDWPKIKLVRCGIDFDAFPPKPDRAPNQKVRIVSVTRLDREKGIPGLIEALAIVRDAGIDAELRIIGEGPDRALLEAQIERLGLKEHCSLPGKKGGKDVVAELHQADIFALASLIEGLPVVLMESMAVGLPVIAPWITGIPELVVPEKTGLLYPAANWPELADCIIRLAKEPELRSRLAQSGQIQVRRLHDIHQVVEPLLEMFHSAR